MMQPATFDLAARRHDSRVLAGFLASRPGSAERAGVELMPMPQNVATGKFAVSSDADAMRALFQPLTTASGFAVTDTTAMTVATVYACLRLIAGAILQLPIHQYRLVPGGDRERMDPTPIWRLLNQSPDAAWTAAAWKEWIIRCWGLRGDHVTEILRAPGQANGGKPIGLRPLHPDHVTIRRLDHRLAYDIFDPMTGTAHTVDQDDVLHFTGFGFDGLKSLSVVQWAARNAIGNALAATDYMGRSVGEGAMPKIALTFPNRIGKDQAQGLRDSFVATYTGPQSARIPLVLTEGGAATTLSIKPVDMQLIESRRFEKQDICEAMGVPPILIGDSEKTTSWGTGIEQITLGFVKYTLAPMLCRWEEEINRKLFGDSGMFVEFTLAALLRGDSKTQAEVFRAGLGGPGTGDGWLTVDEVRTLQNLPALGGASGKPYLSQRGKPTTPAPTTTPEPPAEPDDDETPPPKAKRKTKTGATP